MYTSLRLLALCVMVIGLTGCAWGDTTVTDNPAYPTNFQRNTVYVLQQDVFLLPTGGPSGVHYYACKQGEALNHGPDSVADYEANKAHWSKRDVHVARAGTKFRFIDLVVEVGPDTGPMLTVVGQMLDTNAPRGGRVELREISHYRAGDLGVSIDEAYLRAEPTPADKDTVLPVPH